MWNNRQAQNFEQDRHDRAVDEPRKRELDVHNLLNKKRKTDRPRRRTTHKTEISLKCARTLRQYQNRGDYKLYVQVAEKWLKERKLIGLDAQRVQKELNELKEISNCCNGHLENGICSYCKEHAISLYEGI